MLIPASFGEELLVQIYSIIPSCAYYHELSTFNNKSLLIQSELIFVSPSRDAYIVKIYLPSNWGAIIPWIQFVLITKAIIDGLARESVSKIWDKIQSSDEWFLWFHFVIFFSIINL